MNSGTGKPRKSFNVVYKCTVAESSRADEASIVLLQLSSSGLSKTTIGLQSEQRIGSVWGFCKEFEDRLDFKCNLREVIEVHVSRNL